MKLSIDERKFISMFVILIEFEEYFMRIISYTS